MSWRVAKSLLVLRDQVNAACPNRSKVSDGTIGDAAHASRSSDHNPWVRDGGTGVVTAIDITHDPASGADMQRLADELVASGDPRIKYIIWNHRIWNPSIASHWRSYGGSNPHTKHLHLSVQPRKAHYDDTRQWAAMGTAQGITPQEDDDVIRYGQEGPEVKQLQHLLSRAIKLTADTGGDIPLDGGGTPYETKSGGKGSHLVVDGKFGAKAADFAYHARLRAQRRLGFPLYSPSAKECVTSIDVAALVRLCELLS